MRTKKKLSGFTGNGANGQWQLELPGNQKYHSISLVKTSGTVAITTITAVRLILDDDPVIDISGQQLDELNKAAGLPAYATNGVLQIPLDMTGMKNVAAFISTAVNIGPVSTNTGKSIKKARLELVVAGATNPNIDVYAVVSPATSEGPGAIKRIKSHVIATAVGTVSYDKLEAGSNRSRLWSRVGFVTPAGVLSVVRMLGDNGPVLYEDSLADMTNDVASSTSGRGLGSYFDFLVDPNASGVDEFIDTLGFEKVNVYVTSDTAESVAVVHEYVGSL